MCSARCRGWSSDVTDMAYNRPPLCIVSSTSEDFSSFCAVQMGPLLSPATIVGGDVEQSCSPVRPSGCSVWLKYDAYYLGAYSRFATINMGRKLGAVAPFYGGAESPSTTMSPGPRPISIPSGILMHPSIWPQ